MGWLESRSSVVHQSFLLKTAWASGHDLHEQHLWFLLPIARAPHPLACNRRGRVYFGPLKAHAVGNSNVFAYTHSRIHNPNGLIRQGVFIIDMSRKARKVGKRVNVWIRAENIEVAKAVGSPSEFLNDKYEEERRRRQKEAPESESSKKIAMARNRLGDLQHRKEDLENEMAAKTAEKEALSSQIMAT